MTPHRRFALALILPLLAFAALAVSARLFPSGPRQALSSPPAAASGPSPSAMAAMLPPGALLTIESPDFATLLQSWSASPESASWLKSANYSVFQNSRLFGRLSAAQDEFASTARLASAGTSLLAQVAGRQSIFAWYDIGELQFLYITRMPAGHADPAALFTQRASFERRQAGASVFYVRSQAVPGSTRTRTVAFASVGDLLLLSTREDLMAGALALVAAPGPGSQAAEPWYLKTSAAQPASDLAPDLHMVLDLERIVPTPYFRSYWVQQNITEFKGYRSAVSDLYREHTTAGTRFREERTILPETGHEPITGQDLAPLAALVPPGTGVFRVQGTADAEAAVATLDEKLISKAVDPSTPSTEAPDPDLTPTLAGDPSDLETRIDTPTPVAASSSSEALIALVNRSGLQATLTLDTASDTHGPWLPIHTAVVFRTARPLPPDTLAAALQQLLRGTLTASSLGIELRPTPANPAILTLSGPKAIFLTRTDGPGGPLTIFSDDLLTLTALLTRTAAPSPSPVIASFLGGFDHTSQRAPFARLSTLIDSSAGQTAASGGTPDVPSTPPFFSGNIRSLSETFSRLQSEHVLISNQGPNIHQTVTYQWTP